MADNLDLKIIIDTLLNSKGFEEAQAGLKGLVGATNESAGIATKTAGAQKGLAKELGGSRGAVADLTRVLLMNIGVTGAAGNVAKAAGIGMTALGGAINPVTIGATALVAVAALLIPKLVEWARSTQDTEKATADLKTSIVGMLPELEEYVRTVPNATAELQALFEVSRQEAFRKQKQEIADLTKQANELEKEIAALTAGTGTYTINVRGSIETHKVSAETLAKNRDKATELGVSLTETNAKLNALLAAQEDEILLGSQIRDGIDQERDRREKLEKALREQRREQERLKKLREDDLRLDFKLRSEKAKAENEAKAQHKKDVELAAERILWIEREKRARREEVEESKRASREKRADQAAQTAASASYYLSFFTQNRAVRIAQAIADTYAAATRALAEFPFPANTVIAGIMVAAGLKNVSEIRKAEVGFDDPVNDMLAQRLGRKFATDVLQHINAGFGGGLRDLSGRGGNVVNQTTINRGMTMNVTANGVIGSRTAFRSFLEREMTLAERSRRRKTIG